jgi:ATPase subunit of ABC transporter with duplicated ATPase domains
MAIATATSLDVHMGGELLFAGVSFKLEPRERMTLSGRNGAGKSTLLRLLAGELTPDGGSIVVQKGARVALHDQRPPHQTEASLGEYVFSGRAEMLATEAELRELEQELADPEAWSSPGRAERAEAQHAAAKRAVTELVERWEAAEAEAEAASLAGGPG